MKRHLKYPLRQANLQKEKVSALGSPTGLVSDSTAALPHWAAVSFALSIFPSSTWELGEGKKYTSLIFVPKLAKGLKCSYNHWSKIFRCNFSYSIFRDSIWLHPPYDSIFRESIRSQIGINLLLKIHLTSLPPIHIMAHGPLSLSSTCWIPTHPSKPRTVPCTQYTFVRVCVHGCMHVPHSLCTHRQWKPKGYSSLCSYQNIYHIIDFWEMLIEWNDSWYLASLLFLDLD